MEIETTQPTKIQIEPFSRVVSPGTIPDWNGRSMRVFVKVKLDLDGELHITGVEGPRSNGNCAGGAGQIVMSWDSEYLAAMTFNLVEGWNRAKVERLAEIWHDWHLNHMRAGTPAQTAYLKAHRVKATYPASQYDRDLKTLSHAGLNLDPDTGYRYGTAWLREDVPADVIDWLRALTDTSKPYAWV